LHLTLSAPSRNRRERKSLRAESRFAVVARPGRGASIAVPLPPIRSADIAHRVAGLLHSFLLLPDVRHTAAPRWAFDVRDQLTGRLAGVRVDVVPIPTERVAA
jgi:hypothetical protein